MAREKYIVGKNNLGISYLNEGDVVELSIEDRRIYSVNNSTTHNAVNVERWNLGFVKERWILYSEETLYLQLGKRVVSTNPLYDGRGPGTVVGGTKRQLLVEHDNWNNGHNGNAACEWGRVAVDDRGWYYSMSDIRPENCPPVGTPMEPAEKPIVEYVTGVNDSWPIRSGDIYKTIPVAAKRRIFEGDCFGITHTGGISVIGVVGYSIKNLRPSTREEIAVFESGFGSLWEYRRSLDEAKMVQKQMLENPHPAWGVEDSFRIREDRDDPFTKESDENVYYQTPIIMKKQPSTKIKIV